MCGLQPKAYSWVGSIHNVLAMLGWFLKDWLTPQVDATAPHLVDGGHIYNAPGCTAATTQTSTDTLWCVHLTDTTCTLQSIGYWRMVSSACQSPACRTCGYPIHCYSPNQPTMHGSRRASLWTQSASCVHLLSVCFLWSVGVLILVPTQGSCCYPRRVCWDPFVDEQTPVVRMRYQAVQYLGESKGTLRVVPLVPAVSVPVNTSSAVISGLALEVGCCPPLLCRGAGHSCWWR